MYTYYALTTFGPSVQPYLWWKRYLTRLQMIQFILVMINAAKTFMSQDCKFPILFAYLQASVATAFFVLFAMFYRNAYQKKKSHEAKQKQLLQMKDDLLLEKDAAEHPSNNNYTNSHNNNYNNHNNNNNNSSSGSRQRQTTQKVVSEKGQDQASPVANGHTPRYSNGKIRANVKLL